MARFVAFLRAINVGTRRVDMATARQSLVDIGLTEVASFLNSGNLLFSADADPAALQTSIREALESVYGFEITTFVRTAAEVTTLATDKPFGIIRTGYTHFVLLPLAEPTMSERQAIHAMSNDHDEVLVRGRDVHWLIRSRSIDTTLGPTQWKRALGGNPSTARNTTMMAKLAQKLAVVQR